MAYIGTQPKDVRSFGRAKFDFTATQGQTAFTGADDDSKTLGFTDGQIEVYVNGILMDESDFTTSNSNTVTLASAANLNDVISIVAMQTDIPNSDYVPASGGTFTAGVTVQGTVAATAYTGDGSGLTGTGSPSIDDNGNATAVTIDTSERVGIGTSTPLKKLHLADAGDTHMVLQSTNAADNSEMFEIAVGANAANKVDLTFRTRLNTGSGGTEHMRITNDGLVTKPSQCYFSIGAPGNQSNISNSGYDTITFSNETFDTGNNFASNTFTAPITGKYLFCLNMRLDNVDTSVAYYNIGINTSNRGYYQLFAPTFASDPPYYNFMKSIIADMDVNDTATVSIFQNGGTAQTDINSSTRWYGYLLG